uniref:Uncharacterized protein n=1 Tax=Oryza glumipatula TaxID=40148 RepID=A0A0D9Y8H3_9ORYZ
MVEYILGVPDPLQWHSEVGLLHPIIPLLWFDVILDDLERNPAHYSGWMARLGPVLYAFIPHLQIGCSSNCFITRLANNIGIGVTPEDGGVRVSHPAALSPQPAAGLSFSLRRTGTPPSTTAVGRVRGQTNSYLNAGIDLS